LRLAVRFPTISKGIKPAEPPDKAYVNIIGVLHVKMDVASRL